MIYQIYYIHKLCNNKYPIYSRHSLLSAFFVEKMNKNTTMAVEKKKRNRKRQKREKELLIIMRIKESISNLCERQQQGNIIRY